MSVLRLFKKIEAQVNPFDHGATFNNPNPPSGIAQQIQQSQIQSSQLPVQHNLGVTIATPPQPQILDENNQSQPATLPVKFGNTTYQSSLPYSAPNQFELNMQRFNGLTNSQRAQELGQNDWEQSYVDSYNRLNSTPQVPHTYTRTNPLIPILDKIKRIF